MAAGFDRFAPDLFSLYFNDYAQELGTDIRNILALGRADAQDPNEHFNMAYLAVRGSAAVNGVSRLHGEVSRSIFQPLFPRWPRQEVPVGHVTNGVHVPSWDSSAADALWTEACGKSRWMGELKTMESELRSLPEEDLWLLRTRGRRQLIQFLRQGRHREKGELDPDALTLGFARRFAEYKRTNLLLHDPSRLKRLLSDRSRPVQLVFSGKAHPRDEAGKECLREWQEFVEQYAMHDRVVFVEDYDLRVAAQLVQGVDVWINTPRRPWEASGTSGMKVLVNGGLNLSELDGWWAEAYTPEAGWALGDGREHGTDWDATEAMQLYSILEGEVIPRFYQRDEAGFPREWIGLIRESMAKLTARYSTNRMLREYVEDYYLPLAEAYGRRSRDLAVELEEWHGQLGRHWNRIRFGSAVCSEENDALHWEVQVYLDDL
ncbi:MAG: alpha-glucan phosphorylase, partial [Deltaproteobacteria bacterium 21-66-5]